MKKQGVRGFCYEENLGVIVEGQFYPLKFEPIKFMRILVKLMHEKDYITADLLLKDAIISYTSATMLSKVFKTKNLSDSLFYMKWRNFIKNNKRFYKKQEVLQQKRTMMRETAKKAKIEVGIKGQLVFCKRNNSIHSSAYVNENHIGLLSE